MTQVYFAGPDYFHSEVRRSPVNRQFFVPLIEYLSQACGWVDRDKQGKEKRYPILLTSQEKIIARKVWSIFKVVLINNIL